jgi:O-methyltransferase involved in polyketide biosynthesis
LDYDFGDIKKAFGEYGGLAYIVRARKMEDTIQRFVSEHPHTTVVHIGAGLDTTFSRVDNGAIRWYDMDISEVIALRKKIIPEGDRNRCIARSVFDYSMD